VCVGGTRQHVHTVWYNGAQLATKADNNGVSPKGSTQQKPVR